MKLNIVKTVAATSLLALPALTACEDQMNYDEYEVYGDDYMTSHWSRVEGVVDLIYNQLESDFGAYSGAMMASATDEAVYSHAGSSIEAFYNGAWSAANDKAHIWGGAFKGIEYANLVLGSFSGLTFDNYRKQSGFINSYRKYLNFQWECRFLRAYYYFSLVREYGGVPLITTELSTEELNSLPRNTSDEVFDFIESECNAIVDSIVRDYNNPGWATNTFETGRANFLAVMALRSRAALYHASPLFAGSADAHELWGKAAKYAKIAIDSCEARGLSLNASYADLFQPESYKLRNEVIWDRRGTATNNNFEKYNFPIGMVNAGGGNCPTQNLVDAYEMKNGKAIDEEGSGYDPQNPYVGRDDRFYATVAYNGDAYPQKLPTIYLQLYTGGANALPNVNATPTGYYLKKYCVASTDISGSTGTYHNWLIFRLAELYLNYAEAMINYAGSGYATAEYDGTSLDLTAAQAINKVRARAGQPDIAEGLSADDFMARYKNEKFVEFAFENHRFYDIRRWKEADKHLEIKSMNITLVSDSVRNTQVLALINENVTTEVITDSIRVTTKSGDETTTATFAYDGGKYDLLTDTALLHISYTDASYSTYNVVSDNTTRKWNDRNYLFPIPQADMQKQNGGWTQNPGW